MFIFTCGKSPPSQIDVYRTYHDMVRQITQSVLKNAAMAEEAAQETFRKYTERAHKFKSDEDVRYWLLVVARTTAIDRAKSENRWRSTFACSIDDAEVKLAAEGCDPADIVEKRELYQAISEILDHMESKYSIPIRLKYFHDWHSPRIGSLLGLNPATVLMRLSRGRKMVFEELLERGFDYLKGGKGDV